ncbi:MAG: histidine phosphatase family protein [Minisyncoccota bacterium]
MKITFVRHAESIANAEKILAVDSVELTLDGIKQAEKVAHRLKDEGFNVVLSSPIRRAFDTAKIITEVIKTPIITDELLAEKTYGSLSGKPLEEVNKEKDKMPNLRDFTLGYDYRYWGGESGLDIKERVLKFSEKVKIEYEGKKVLAVTHGGIIRMMYIVFKNREYKEAFPIPNVSVHEFEL